MKMTPSILLNIVLVTVLATSMFFISTTASTAEYNPWSDIDGDGDIDIYDVVKVTGIYHTLGDPTRNVTVTNWPQTEKPLFPENLILRGTAVFAPSKRWNLIDEATPYPLHRVDYDWTSSTLNSTRVLVYNKTLIHEKIPVSTYRILGMPTVSFTYNVTNSPATSFSLLYYAYLGKISMDGKWTALANIVNYGFGKIFSGEYTDYQYEVCFRPSSPFNITIEPYERLAIRLEVYGETQGGTTGLILKILYSKDTDEFLVDIPIVKNP